MLPALLLLVVVSINLCLLLAQPAEAAGEREGRHLGPSLLIITKRSP